ncbi:MAG: rod shape-determining protein MreC [Patescibacteria group bacterium]
MKNMLSPQQRNTSRTTIVLFLLLISGGALFVVFTKPVRLSNTLLTLATPLFRARAQVLDTEADMALRLRSNESIEEENKRLRDEVTRLRMRAALYDNARQELLRLEDLLNRSRAPGILARVLASPAASPYDTLILDMGSDDGIGIGHTVLFDGVVSAGVIEATGKHVSRARLLSSPGLTREVTVGTSTTPLSAVGKGGGMFEIEAPRDLIVTPGMVVYARGSDAIAFVVESTAESADAFQTVYAVFPINLFETREVIVEATPSREL